MGTLPFGDGITSLTFITNENVYGPFGCPSRNSFESPSHQRVTSFFGSSGMFLDHFTDTSMDNMVSKDHITIEGPWGGLQGSSFYDGAGDIVEIVVTYSDIQVISLQTSYGHSGLCFTTKFHGHANQDIAKV